MFPGVFDSEPRLLANQRFGPLAVYHCVPGPVRALLGTSLYLLERVRSRRAWADTSFVSMYKFMLVGGTHELAPGPMLIS